MNRNDLKRRLQELAKEEYNRAEVKLHAPHRVALVYPNTYFVGMSNLGLQLIYQEINSRPDTVAERVFLPEGQELRAYEKTNTPLMSVESQRPLYDFGVVGFDITFEMDYFMIPKMLKMGKIPLWAAERGERDAWVIAGGPCATFNPEPLADFIDAFVIGEGENLISEMLDVIQEERAVGASRQHIRQQLSQIQGVYVPALYTPLYEGDKIVGIEPMGDAPPKIIRRWAPLTKEGETVVATDYTEFGSMYIVEVARGCGRHCRFCMAGYCYRTPRVRPLEMLKVGVDRAAALDKKVGLMGAAISDYPEIDELVTYIRSKGLRYSCASLRADSLTQAVVDGLAASGQKTITIAPEAGSERLRRVINKGISEADLRKAVTLAAGAGIPHIRLYLMVGLPSETAEDIDELIELAKRTYSYMLEAGCKGRLTLSINPFIPKPFTPFQWEPMADQKEVDRKLQYIKQALKGYKRIEVLVESTREAYIQGVLARGDRRLGKVLAQAADERGAKSFKQVCKCLQYDGETVLYRRREVDELLPWSMLDMQLAPNYLAKELEAGRREAYTAPCCEGCKRCGVCQ